MATSTLLDDLLYDVIADEDGNVPDSNEFSPCDRHAQRARIRANYARMRAAHEDGRPLGPCFLSEQLTQSMGGYAHVGNYLWLGKPGTGKSTAVACCALVNPETTILYLSAEMPEDVVYHRLVANVTNKFISRLDEARVSLEDYEHLCDETDAKSEHIHIVDVMGDPEPWTVARIEALAAKLKGDREHLMVILDSFHSWASGLPIEDEERVHYEKLLAELNAMAKRLNAVNFLIVERNRNNSGGGMQASSGTRRFEFLANGIFDLDLAYFDEKDGKVKAVEDRGDTANACQEANEQRKLNPSGAKFVKVSVRKNRFGSNNFFVLYKFIGQTMRFVQYDDTMGWLPSTVHETALAHDGEVGDLPAVPMFGSTPPATKKRGKGKPLFK